MCRWKTTFKQQHKNGSDDSTKTPVNHSTIWLTIRLSSLTQLCFFIFFLSKCVAEWWRDNFPTTKKKHFGSIINERKAENELIFGLGYGRQSSLNAIGIERMSLPYYQELTTTTTKNNLETTVYTLQNLYKERLLGVCVCVYIEDWLERKWNYTSRTRLMGQQQHSTSWEDFGEKSRM